jgi:heptosyltransferase-2
MTPLREFVTDSRRAPRILVRSVNCVGDAVMSMPAVQRLRELEPEAHIALTCPGNLQPLWQHNPFLNEVIPFDGRAAPIHLLAERDYDVAVIFPNSFSSAWECWRAGIPCRVGFAGRARRWLLTDIVKEARGERFVHKKLNVAGKEFRVKSCEVVRHQVRRYLDIISYLGGNRSHVPPKIWLAPGELPSLTKFAHDDGRQFIAINAGAEYGPARRWMPDRFAEVARRISEEWDCRCLLLGGLGDTAIAGQIEAKLRETVPDGSFVVNVAGKATLLELCALLRRCRLVVTNDAGPMHVAAALGVPVVAVFGSTEPELTGPLHDRAVVVRERVECSPCFLRECPIDFRCMERVTAERVAEAALKLLRA